MISSVSIADIFFAWISRAGDTDISSIVNTVLYAVAVWAAARRWQMLKRLHAPPGERHFWLILLLVLAVLGLNKQLDFQVLLIEIGKPIAMQGGWYQSRRLVLAVFAFFLTGLAGVFIAGVIYLIRNHWRNHRYALAGLLVLCGYAVLEATSLSHVGVGIDLYKKWGVRLSDVIEMLGIILMTADALNSRNKHEALR